jgi:hypothetical protein
MQLLFMLKKVWNYESVFRHENLALHGDHAGAEIIMVARQTFLSKRLTRP